MSETNLDDDLLRDLPVEIWLESDVGRSLLELAREGRCRYVRLNSTLGRFEQIDLPHTGKTRTADHLDQFERSPYSIKEAERQIVEGASEKKGSWLPEIPQPS